MRLLTCLALAFLGSAGALADEARSSGPGIAPAPAACRQATGGRIHGLRYPVIWHARYGCGEGTLVWFQTMVGSDGATPVWRVDDLLVVPVLEKDQALSLLSPLNVDCRHHADRQSFVIAVGGWDGRAGRGDRQRVDRAWRLDAEDKKVLEVPILDVACVLR